MSAAAPAAFLRALGFPESEERPWRHRPRGAAPSRLLAAVAARPGKWTIFQLGSAAELAPMRVHGALEKLVGEGAIRYIFTGDRRSVEVEVIQSPTTCPEKAPL